MAVETRGDFDDVEEVAVETRGDFDDVEVDPEEVDPEEVDPEEVDPEDMIELLALQAQAKAMTEAMAGLVSQNNEFVIIKRRNCVSKTRIFVLTMMNVAAGDDSGAGGGRGRNAAGSY